MWTVAVVVGYLAFIKAYIIQIIRAVRHVSRAFDLGNGLLRTLVDLNFEDVIASRGWVHRNNFWSRHRDGFLGLFDIALGFFRSSWATDRAVKAERSLTFDPHIHRRKPQMLVR